MKIDWEHCIQGKNYGAQGENSYTTNKTLVMVIPKTA